MKKSILFIVVQLVFSLAVFAQPLSGSYYTEGQKKLARETAEMDRHYKSISPSNFSSSSSNGPISGNYNSYGSADYSKMSGINEAAAKQKARNDAWIQKENKIKNLIASRGIHKSESYYPELIKAALDGGFDRYSAERFFGENAEDFKRRINNPSSSIHEWFAWEEQTTFMKNMQPKKEIIEKKEPEIPKGVQEQINRDNVAITNNANRISSSLDYAQNKENSYENRLYAIDEAINSVKEINKVRWYSDDKLSYQNLEYGKVNLFIENGDYIKAANLLSDMINRPSDKKNKIPKFKLFETAMYVDLLLDAYFGVDFFRKRYYGEYKYGPFYITPCYAQYLKKDINATHKELDFLIKNNNKNKLEYDLYKIALFIIDKKGNKAIKYAEKNDFGIFDDEKSLTNFVLNNFIEWNNEALKKDAVHITPETLFRLDMMKMLAPGNVSILETSLMCNIKMFREKHVLADDNEITKLGGNSNLPAQITNKQIAEKK